MGGHTSSEWLVKVGRNTHQARVAHEKTLFAEKMPYEVKTTVCNFYFSHSIISKRRIQQLANLMEDGVKSGQSTSDFINKVERELHSVEFQLYSPPQFQFYSPLFLG